VKGIAPVDEVLRSAPAVSLRQFDLFNARAAVGEFSVALKELEAEHARLQSEEEMARQVERMMRQQ
jgi:hypothetical protein